MRNDHRCDDDGWTTRRNREKEKQFTLVQLTLWTLTGLAFISFCISFRYLIAGPAGELGGGGPKLNVSDIIITGRHCHPPHCRNVIEYGAIGDGVADDTAALVKTLTEGRGDDPSQSYFTIDPSGDNLARNPEVKYSTSTEKALHVFLPAGHYRITKTLPLVFYTALAGEGLNSTRIIFDPDESYCNGSAGFPESPDGAFPRPPPVAIDAFGRDWVGEGLCTKTKDRFIPQNNFYRSIRDLTIDLSSRATARYCGGVGWTVSQATSLGNISIAMSQGNGVGIVISEGSGGMLGDIEIVGGKIGMWVGNQQFTCRNVVISNASDTGVWLHWNWQWTFTSLEVRNSHVGIRLGQSTSDPPSAGALALVDSEFFNVTIGIELVVHGKTDFGQAHALLDNVKYEKVAKDVVRRTFVDHDASRSMSFSTLFAPTGDSGHIPMFAVGNVLNGEGVEHSWEGETLNPPSRPAVLQAAQYTGQLTRSGSSFFGSARPVWAGWSWAMANPTQWMDASYLDYPVPHNATFHVTAQLQAAINLAASRHAVLFLRHGNYYVDDEIVVPPGSRIVGEVWSNIIAVDGGSFSSPDNPRPLIRVGGEDVGTVGLAQIVDINLGAKDPLPGCILLQWNMKYSNEQDPSATGIWDVHTRVGGGAQTNLKAKECGRTQPEIQNFDCGGVHTLMHVTRHASLYMEGSWLWVADHDIDTPSVENNMDQINIFNSRGLLVEANPGPVFMYGTGVEHSILYQYNLHNAKNVAIFMAQAEQPYFQPVLAPPMAEDKSMYFASLIQKDRSSEPVIGVDICKYEVGIGDTCEMALSLKLKGVEDLFLYGTGFYSFFNAWSTDCRRSCQAELISIVQSSNIHLYVISVYGGEFMTMKETDATSKLAEHLQMPYVSTCVADLQFDH